MHRIVRITDWIADIAIGLLKGLWIFLLTMFTNFFQPIHDFLLIIFILFILNFLYGLLSDMIQGSDFSLKKAFQSIWHVVGFMLLLFLSFGIGKKMHLPDDSVVDFTSWITWVVIYFYGVNILRNWKAIQPKNQVVAFLYWVLSVKFVEKIKYLREYFSKQ
ncbi:MAG: phage holin family protein [Prevotella sp.]|jgi:exosortase/archaeosortase|nr:phage holin family protein [Prevotella sp.]